MSCNLHNNLQISLFYNVVLTSIHWCGAYVYPLVESLKVFYKTAYILNRSDFASIFTWEKCVLQLEKTSIEGMGFMKS